MKKPSGSREEYIDYLCIALQRLYILAMRDYFYCLMMWVIFLWAAWLIWICFGISFISLAFGACAVLIPFLCLYSISDWRHVVYFRMDVCPRLFTLIKKDLQSQVNMEESMEKSSGDKKDFVGILCMKFRNFYLLCIFDIVLFGASIICWGCYGYFLYLSYLKQNIPAWLYINDNWMPASIGAFMVSQFLHSASVKYFKNETYPHLLKLFRKDLTSQPNDESPWRRE